MVGDQADDDEFGGADGEGAQVSAQSASGMVFSCCLDRNHAVCGSRVQEKNALAVQ
jgi:hypothetical protein